MVNRADKIEPISLNLITQDAKIEALILTVNALVKAHNALDVSGIVKKELDEVARQAGLRRGL